MKLSEKIVLGACAASIVIPVKSYLKTKRETRERIRQIQLNSERELRAIHVAAARVEERIRSGEYDGRGITAIMNDFKFEEIIDLNKD